MATYSIKDLEQITGIKAHTLRIWERRYNLVIPKRTPTNIRYYTDDDLRHLLNIALLKSCGIKISTLARMNDIEIQTRVLEVTRQEGSLGCYIDQLVLAMVNFDQLLFERILSLVILQKGMEDAFCNLLFPFFQRVGALWQTGSVNPAQEHFASNLIRQKLFVAMDTLPIQGREDGLKIIFFLREGELHEIGLLFYTYIAKRMGHKTIYLGQNVPIKDLASTVESFGADVLFTSLITPLAPSNTKDYLKELSSRFGNFKIGITGFLTKQITNNIPSIFQLITSPNQFRVWLNTSLKQQTTIHNS